VTTKLKPVLTGVREIRTREEAALLRNREGETGGKEEGNPGLVPIPKPNPPGVLFRKVVR
jgi:hypothetical protein